MAEGFGQAIDNARRVMPGLDLAVEVRQLHAQGKNIDAIRAIRTALDCNLLTGVEWLTALTGWTPRASAAAIRAAHPERFPTARAETSPELTAKALGGALAVTLEQLARRLSENYPERGVVMRYIGDEIHYAAGEVRRLAQ